MKDRDLLAFGEGQISARHGDQLDGRHPASLAEPPRPDCRRHAGPDRSLLARQAAGRSPPRTGLDPRGALSTADPATTCGHASPVSPAAACRHPSRNTSFSEVLRRPVESALRALVREGFSSKYTLHLFYALVALEEMERLRQASPSLLPVPVRGPGHGGVDPQPEPRLTSCRVEAWRLRTSCWGPRGGSARARRRYPRCLERSEVWFQRPS